MNSRFILPVLLCCLLYHGLSGVAADVMSVSVMEGDSVTLPTDVKTNQQESIKWYFGDTRIAEISANQSKICTDVQCKDGDKRFRDRLKLDHQTGSLTIMNTRTTDSGVYHLLINGKSSKSEKIFRVTVQGFFSDGKNGVSVFLMEGDSVTFHTGVETNQQVSIKWYFIDTLIAQMNGEQSKICTDVQCNEGTERFRDRLKLDNQTGSLTIMNTRNTDSGDYKLLINSKSSSVPESFYFALHVVPALKLDEMKEGGNVTLYTDVIKNPKDVMMWHFNDILIAGDLSKICSDDECKERFRNRLKLDHQTGSLTIMNTRNTDSGDYKLVIISSGSEKIFRVAVNDVPAAQRDEKKTKSVVEGESVTLHPGVTKTPNVVMTWYCNETLIAELTGDQSNVCSDDECKERFRDRLKLDHQTGSLTIMNTRTTDSGEYKLQISSRSSSVVVTSLKSFSISITAVPGSGLSSGAIAGICVALLLVVCAVGGGLALRKRICMERKNKRNDVV